MSLPIPPNSWDSGLLLTFRRTTEGYGLVAVNDDGSPISGGGGGSDVFVQNALITVAYDTIMVTATDANDNPTTIQYLTGGLSGTVVATINLVYDASGNFQSVTRS